MNPDGAMIEQVFHGFCIDVEEGTNETSALKLLKEVSMKYEGVTYVKLDLSKWTEAFSRLRACM